MEKDLKEIKEKIEKFIKTYDSRIEVTYDGRNRVYVSAKMKV